MAGQDGTGIRGVKSRDRSDAPGAKLGMWATLVGLIFLTIWAVSAVEEAPDFHYETAKRKLATYEDSKHPDSRDYSLPVYGKVLAELALVDPDSVSASAASALQANLEVRIAADQRDKDERREAGRERVQAREDFREAGDMAREWSDSLKGESNSDDE